jgi:hypothetical protein
VPEALGLIFILLVSVGLAMAAARAVLGVVLYAVSVTVVRPPSGSLVPPTTAYFARRFSISQDQMRGHEGVAALVAREAA